jgi:hypothetical protein
MGHGDSGVVERCGIAAATKPFRDHTHLATICIRVRQRNIVVHICEDNYMKEYNKQLEKSSNQKSPRSEPRFYQAQTPLITQKSLYTQQGEGFIEATRIAS